MHPTTERLFEALQEIAGVNGWHEPGRAAAYLGESQATVTNWRTRGVSQGGMLKACAKLGVNAQWLASGQGHMHNIGTNTLSELTGVTDLFETKSDNIAPAGNAGRARLVRVIGTARVGDNGTFDEVVSMVGDGVVEAYSEDLDAYAYKIRGDSLYPVIRDGWILVVEPSTPAQPGDFVLIKLANGQTLVRELISQRPDAITVVTVNGESRTSFGLDELDPFSGVRAVSSIVSPRKWRPGE